MSLIYDDLWTGNINILFEMIADVKHDVIMFVIDDSDNFDSDVITRRIVEILEAQKPCIIVINRKNDSTENEILEIKNKLDQNIKVLSNVPQNYDFVAVDAESALRARREDKKALLADSGIDVLESLIVCVMSRKIRLFAL